MPDQFEHYITKNIKAFYKRRLLTPILYLIFLLVLWFVLSLSAPLFPDTLDAPDTLESTYRRHKEYISATLSDLKFTGYTQSFLGHISGYYYYTMRNDECIIVLLSRIPVNRDFRRFRRCPSVPRFFTVPRILMNC